MGPRAHTGRPQSTDPFDERAPGILEAALGRTRIGREETMSDRNQQIEIIITDGILNISIGVDLLVHAVTNGSDFWDEVSLKVTDNDLFVAAIAHELELEQEDGTTLVHLMFDKAAENAVENGCEGIEETEEEEEGE